jgi:hypothetical protein
MDAGVLGRRRAIHCLANRFQQHPGFIGIMRSRACVAASYTVAIVGTDWARRTTTPNKAIKASGATGTPACVASERATNGSRKQQPRINFSHGK